MALSGNWPGVGPISGDGTYTVQGLGTKSPTLAIQANGTTFTKVVNASGSAELDLQLTPLQTGDCK